jgi:hypothetical protein
LLLLLLLLLLLPAVFMASTSLLCGITMLLFLSTAPKASELTLLLLLPFAACPAWLSAVVCDPARLSLLLLVKALLSAAREFVMFSAAPGALLAAIAAVLPGPCALLFPASGAATAAGCAKLHGRQTQMI